VAELAEMVKQVRAVAKLADPLGRKLDAVELDDAGGSSRGTVEPMSQKRDMGHPIQGLHMQKVSVPLGVLAVIFEARPDAVTQIAALALKSGNSVILKPGREVERTAEALVHVLRETLAAQGLPCDAVSLVLGRERVLELLGEHKLVDLVIPRGSKTLVEFVQANTRIPVLGHSEGVCHIYVDRACDEAMALRVIEDAKCDYPAACNAVETVLVHCDIAKEFLPKLAKRLHARGVKIHAEDDAAPPVGQSGGVSPTDSWGSEPQAMRAPAGAFGARDASGGGASTPPVGQSGGISPTDSWGAEPQAMRAPSGEAHPMRGPSVDWRKEHCGLELSVGVVASIDAAIAHIHEHGSAHTESIITEDAKAAERFLREVDSASVLHNASTRFADGFRYGFGAEVGVSTSKFHARGPVGLEGLTTYKYLLRGHGHVAGDYRGEGARAFTHRRAAEAGR
jgi:glutamate-5-semialdehyde dehydrogenase